MTWSLTYILSQILTVLEYGLLGTTYLVKRRKLIVILDIISMTSGIFAYLLLGADLGMALSIIILLANFYYLWQESRYKGRGHRPTKLTRRDYLILAIVLLAIACVTVFTYDGPLSLLSVAATTLYEISIWQKRPKLYKFLGIPVAFCWMAYNAFIFSVFGVVCELFMFIAAIVGYVRELRR